MGRGGREVETTSGKSTRNQLELFIIRYEKGTCVTISNVIHRPVI